MNCNLLKQTQINKIKSRRPGTGRRFVFESKTESVSGHDIVLETKIGIQSVCRPVGDNLIVSVGRHERVMSERFECHDRDFSLILQNLVDDLFVAVRVEPNYYFPEVLGCKCCLYYV